MVIRHEPGNEATVFIVSFQDSPHHKAGEPGNAATVFIVSFQGSHHHNAGEPGNEATMLISKRPKL